MGQGFLEEQLPQPRRKAKPLQDDALVLTKATRKAAELLGVSNAELATTLGLSPATVSRLRGGQYVLKPSEKPYELAAHFVRMFRGLDAIMGSNDNASTSWLRSHNSVLGARPIDKIKSVAGLIDVVSYLDARRAPT